MKNLFWNIFNSKIITLCYILTGSITHSPAFITSFPVNAFPNILVGNVLNNIGRNPPFCSLESFLIVSIIPFINDSDSSSDSTTLIRSSISSFKIINTAVSGP